MIHGTRDNHGHSGSRRRAALRIETLLGLGIAMLVLNGCVALKPASEPGFASCEAPQAAARDAGEVGLLLTHERAYSDKRCFFAYESTHATFPVYRDVGGQRSMMGYTCIKQVSPSG